MSNPFKAIGKAFKAVAKVVKKIALPALAIGAAVLTGGAALGVLPGIGSLLGAGGLGLSAGLTSVIATAGQGALMGMAGAAITGGNVLKGATSGFITGGALGALSGPVQSLAGTASSGAKGIGSMVSSANKAALGAVGATAPTSLATSGATAGLSSTTSGIGNIVANAGKVVTPIAAQTSSSGGGILGGIGRFIEKNPLVSAGLIQGIGSGIAAKSQMDEQRKQADAEYARTQANYGTGGFFNSGGATPSTGTGVGSVIQPLGQKKRMMWKVDPRTGELYQEAVNG